MHVFITGTDTNIGKTLVSSWICLHTGYAYFKPIQTGASEGCDRQTVARLAHPDIYPEIYLYEDPVSPHVAAERAGRAIHLKNITFPQTPRLIIEGAGGLMVPLNRQSLMIDLIQWMAVPVILVASSRLGTINHTLLSLEALHARDIKVLGVIMSGVQAPENCEAIKLYGRTRILACIPFLPEITQEALMNVPLSQPLKELFV